MGNVDREEFDLIQFEIQQGRLRLDSLRTFLIALFFYSLLAIGVAYLAAIQKTVGWGNLSGLWHLLFYSEAVLFIGQFIIIVFFGFAKLKISHKVLLLGTILFMYKAAFDPFVTMLIFSKDRGIIQAVELPAFLVILLGIVIHIHSLHKSIRGEKQQNEKLDKTVGWIKIIFLLATVTSIVFQRGYLGGFDMLFLILLISLLYIGWLVFVCEYILAAAYLLRKKRHRPVF